MVDRTLLLDLIFSASDDTGSVVLTALRIFLRIRHVLRDLRIRKIKEQTAFIAGRNESPDEPIPGVRIPAHQITEWLHQSTAALCRRFDHIAYKFCPPDCCRRILLTGTHSDTFFLGIEQELHILRAV